MNKKSLQQAPLWQTLLVIALGIVAANWGPKTEKACAEKHCTDLYASNNSTLSVHKNIYAQQVDVTSADDIDRTKDLLFSHKLVPLKEEQEFKKSSTF
jgi:hypothetical protein